MLPISVAAVRREEKGVFMRYSHQFVTLKIKKSDFFLRFPKNFSISVCGCVLILLCRWTFICSQAEQ